jgi:hypothetical protein
MFPMEASLHSSVSPGQAATRAADCALTSHFAAGDLWVVRAHSTEQVHPQLAELGRRTEASVSAAERSAPGRSRQSDVCHATRKPSGEPYKQQVRARAAAERREFGRGSAKPVWFVATTYNSSPRSGHELDAMRTGGLSSFPPSTHWADDADSNGAVGARRTGGRYLLGAGHRR